jgi:glutathione S-transferase
VLKIWGRTSSSNVMKVLWCCTEINEPYERVDWGGQFGGNDDPAYRDKNPNGRVPTVEDGGTIIWESNSILRYLCTTRGAEQLYPKDPAKRTFVERWMDWQLAHTGGAMTTLFFGHVRTPAEKRNPVALEAARKEAIEVWRIVEHWLDHRGSDYLAGADFSIGDIPVAIQARRWFGFPIERPDLPRLKAWYDRVAVRPGFAKHVGGPMT